MSPLINTQVVKFVCDKCGAEETIYTGPVHSTMYHEPHFALPAVPERWTAYKPRDRSKVKFFCPKHVCFLEVC